MRGTVRKWWLAVRLTVAAPLIALGCFVAVIAPLDTLRTLAGMWGGPLSDLLRSSALLGTAGCLVAAGGLAWLGRRWTLPSAGNSVVVAAVTISGFLAVI